MCTGFGRRKAMYEQARQQQYQANQDAARRQQELDRIAQQRQATALAQQSQAVALQQQQSQQEREMQATTNQLQLEQKQRLGEISARGQSVAGSMQILGGAGQKQAPNASVDKGRKAAGAARSVSAQLRIGGTSAAAGSGSNFAV